ncbi:MAG: hypothetical protein M0Z66_01040 [Thermaerobacter sp.]|nr:hypothetical protein [Thermaerobacter sp.]
MSADATHRLDGLEPDNLLAFLALLGVLRALNAVDRREEKGLRPRASWDLQQQPHRPMLHLACTTTRDQVAEFIAEGVSLLAEDHDFGGRSDLNHPQTDARELLVAATESADASRRGRVDLLASLLTDAAVKSTETIDPTPLCLLFGQGHQHFLDRLASVPALPAPPPRRNGEVAVAISAAECISEALFKPWLRQDPTFSFRWDPQEDVRYALMAGDPTDQAFKERTQHGANRLAAVGLAALTVVPQTRAGRVRPQVIGGMSSHAGFSFAWPIWGEPASLAAIRSLLGHPQLRESGLRHLGVAYVMVARRMSVGKFMNFAQAQVRSGSQNTATAP